MLTQITICSIILIYFIIKVKCIEKELTFSVEPGKESCFYETIPENYVIDIDYQVIDGGDYDINFQLVEPNGKIILADFKKTENAHRIKSIQNGDYRFCWDNTFSKFSQKVVFFELYAQTIDENDSKGWEDNLDTSFLDSLNDDRISEENIGLDKLKLVIQKVRENLQQIEHLQGLIRSQEAKDRKLAEENYAKVNLLSLVQVVIMISAGFLQIVVIKALFDDKSRLHQLICNFKF